MLLVKRFGPLLLLLIGSIACNFLIPADDDEKVPATSPILTEITSWKPPRTAEDWFSNPVRGAVVEIGYGGPDEYNDPPIPSAENLLQLRGVGVRVITLEFQYAWTITPPYHADEDQLAQLAAALDNVNTAGLYAVLAVRNGPGRNAMMPGINDEDVIAALYEDDTAQVAYQSMLKELVGRFQDRSEIIAWEPLVEPALDFYLTDEEPSYRQAADLWNELAASLIAAIREVDEERPIFIEPVNWCGVDGFSRLDHFEDDNIVYSLHTYEPYMFTHQERPPYAAYPGEFDGELVDWTWLDEHLAPVDAFQTQNNVPIVVGEWGGIRWLPGIDQFVTDQLSLFAERNWSWFWYAWDDEEWDELGFEMQMGPQSEAPRYDPSVPAFAPLVAAWQNDTQDAISDQFFSIETRPDGAVRLTDPPSQASDQNPAFSPDGTSLVFTRFNRGYNIGPAGLFLLDLSSAQVERLTPVEDQDNVNLPGSSWNSANNRIVFASDREETDDLWRIAPDGSDFSRITTHDYLSWYIEPSWSPDGQWIVFEENRPGDSEDGAIGQIWKVGADRRDLSQLTVDPAFDDRQPNWSLAGDRILFQRHRPESENWDLYSITPEGSDLQPIVAAPSSDTDASWSLDGRWIVFSSDFGDLPLPNIFIVSSEGGEPIRVTHSDITEDSAPSWSPDGGWIAFESHSGQDEDSPSALWYIATPSTNPDN